MRAASQPPRSTSGALGDVRFRVAARLTGRWWGLVTRAVAHERPRRRGSARCPKSGRTECIDLQAVVNLVDKPDTVLPYAFDPHLSWNADSLDV
ncbi:hypothetical protein GHT09_001490 [Marmota monax]|uniref:Uncharacterized protein n=1 Tax=Marmota monax TaxID=9995 RepID=A0A834V954_MARMO|nr:hypothetical protein GHT09_001490 [Marmota monax]